MLRCLCDDVHAIIIMSWNITDLLLPLTLRDATKAIALRGNTHHLQDIEPENVLRGSASPLVHGLYSGGVVNHHCCLRCSVHTAGQHFPPSSHFRQEFCQDSSGEYGTNRNWQHMPVIFTQPSFRWGTQWISHRCVRGNPSASSLCSR